MKKSILILLSILMMPTIVNAADGIKYELENSEITGDNTVIKTLASASGGKYVKNSDTNGIITTTIDAPESGSYRLIVSYAFSSSNNKKQTIFINDEYEIEYSYLPTGGSSTNFQEADLGIIKLKKGSNKLSIRPIYGYQSYDYITIIPEEDVVLEEKNYSLIDSNATSETVCLNKYLASVYGKSTISGQQEYYNLSREDEFEYIYNTTGKYPAIRGFDLGSESSIMFDSNTGVVDRIEDWVINHNGIAVSSWDLRVPKDVNAWANGTQTGFENAVTAPDETNFDVDNVFIDGTNEKKYIDQSIEKLASTIKKISDKNIPLIFRYLQEAEGNGGNNGEGAWFWYGKNGAESYIKLYRYIQDKLKNYYNIHNLIYVHVTYNNNNYSDKWYPGDDYVDIIGYDRYTTFYSEPIYSPITSTYYNLMKTYKGNKMLTIAENDSVLSSESMKEKKSQWLYFLTWYDNYILDESINSKEMLISTYNAENIITREELPESLYKCNVEEPKEKIKGSETITENPKTGIFSFLPLFLIILAIGYIINIHINNKSLFKKM